MEVFNTIIGVLALIISIVALCHSIYYNLVKLKLSDCVIEQVDKGYDKLYSFSIANLSNVSTIINKIELYDKDGKLLKDNGFNPFRKHKKDYDDEMASRSAYDVLYYPDHYIPLNVRWQSKPFMRETEVFPASKEEFSYYLDKQPYIIKITTDKRIYKFRKYQSFIPHFDDNCQND